MHSTSTNPIADVIDYSMGRHTSALMTAGHSSTTPSTAATTSSNRRKMKRLKMSNPNKSLDRDAVKLQKVIDLTFEYALLLTILYVVDHVASLLISEKFSCYYLHLHPETLFFGIFHELAFFFDSLNVLVDFRLPI
ncbi:unnamed protein product [Toxocara canis]|uniref:Ion_trans domain-containing protein n=1 Tax=Toxocara canis TaxID=6265 RepID=A0A183V7M5_TOXCA|nr:unnamed protein product [Toxocara canis]